jgi:hypothetical protein
MKGYFSEISCFEWFETPEEVAIKIHMLEQEFSNGDRQIAK